MQIYTICSCNKCFSFKIEPYVSTAVVAYLSQYIIIFLPIFHDFLIKQNKHRKLRHVKYFELIPI